MLRRGVFYSHRDLNWILDQYETGTPFALYTGRGPSSGIHIGHMLPWFFTKWLQEKFHAKLYFQMTDDEKFLFKDFDNLEDATKVGYDNILDIIAMGFDPSSRASSWTQSTSTTSIRSRSRSRNGSRTRRPRRSSGSRTRTTSRRVSTPPSKPPRPSYRPS